MADIVKEAREAFGEYESAWDQNYKEAREDINFAKLEKQWPDNILKQREAEQRPCLTINKLAVAIRQVVNDARQNRPSIKVHPVDSKADPETAEVMSGLIRSIEAASDADIAYDTGVDNAVSNGFGYWRVNIDYSNDASDQDDLSAVGTALFEQDILIRRISNPLSVYGDPWATEADSSGWNGCFVIDSVKKTVFQRKYPKAKATDFHGSSWQSIIAPWHTEDAVLVAEYWKRVETMKQAIGVEQVNPESPEAEPEIVVMLLEEFEKLQKEGAPLTPVTQPRPIKCHSVTQYLLNGVEILDEVKWPGKFIPIVPVYGDEVNLEGKRFFRSLIRGAKDSQRMFNYWRTTATEVVALAPRAPWIGRKGSFESDSRWATANTASHAFLEFDGADAPQRQPFAGVPAGMIQEAMNASDDIKAVTGIYDASLGARSNETSGKAIRARQMEGDVSTFHFIDNQTRAIRHTGRILIDLIPKVYSTERIIRILGEDKKKIETRQINKEYEKGKDQEGNPLMAIHDFRVGRYDLTVTSGPSYTTLREEAAAQMIELIRAYPDAAPVIGDLLAKNLDWPGADEIAKRLEKILPPQLRDEETGQVPPEVQGQMQQMAQAIEQLGAMLKEANEKYRLEERKVEIDAQEKEERRNLDWFKALLDAQKVEQASAQADAKLGLENDRMGVETAKTAHAASMAERQMDQADMQTEHSQAMDMERFNMEREQASQPEGPTA